MTTYADKRVTVVGLGREGLAVSRVLSAEGAHVLVADTRDAAALAAPIDALKGSGVRFALGANPSGEALDCDALVLSPGIDKRLPFVREAARRGIAITSETALFFDRCRAPIIGVSGSSGKTTTTTLIGEMLRTGHRPVFVGGNIGAPLLTRLEEITADALVVLELSSFQLEWLGRSPAIAVVTNITPNHLDRHETMEAYVGAKATIVAHQKPDDVAVLNRDDPGSAPLVALARSRLLLTSMTERVVDGAFLDGARLVGVRDGDVIPLCRADEMQVPGRHNIANALAAAAVALTCGIDPIAIGETIRAFRGVAHRLQPVATVAGVTFYDDSIATSPERTRAAIDALAGPLVLILGGRDKHVPWDALARVVVRRCRGVILLGEAAPLIRTHLEEALRRDAADTLLQRHALVEEATMDAAVARATALAQPGDKVVLSPGCASYDMYSNFEERGTDFARAAERRQADGQQ